jgi:hypothetical protein
MFKFRSNTQEQFDSYYTRLTELLESEMHPFRPEFRHRYTSIEEVRKALRNFLKMRSQAMTPR